MSFWFFSNYPLPRASIHLSKHIKREVQGTCPLGRGPKMKNGPIKVPFLVPPKPPKWGYGGTKIGTSGARIEIPRPLFDTN